MNYYKIGEVTKIKGLSRDTPKYYGKIGLIKELEKDNPGRKKYSEKDIGKYAELRYAGDETSGERKKC